MLYLVHGDDFTKSRNLILNQQKKLGIEKRKEFKVGEVPLLDIVNHSKAPSLFGEPNYLVIDCTEAQKSTTDALAEILSKLGKECTTVLLFNKELSATNLILKKAPTLGIKVILNTTVPEGNVFKLLDNLFSKNRTTTYKEYEKLIKENVDPFYLFSMICYQLRTISIITSKSPLAEKLNPYTRNNAGKKFGNYTTNVLTNLYTNFYNLEKLMKTGGISPELAITMAMEKVLNS